jgi:predicted nuclease of predicted toxin-antitoxin system
MKLLFDQNISYRIVKKVLHLFPDCKHISSCGLLNAEDPEIWDYARKLHFTIVTYDSDFYDLGLMNGFPPKIIWIRESNLTTVQLADLLIARFDQINSFLSNDEANDDACLEI